MNEQDFMNAVAGLSDDNRAILNKWIARQWQEGYNKGRAEARELGLSWVEDAETENTGGGCMVDYLKLTNGLTLALSDEYVALYNHPDDLFEGDELEGFWMTKYRKNMEA